MFIIDALEDLGKKRKIPPGLSAGEVRSHQSMPTNTKGKEESKSNLIVKTFHKDRLKRLRLNNAKISKSGSRYVLSHNWHAWVRMTLNRKYKNRLTMIQEADLQDICGKSDRIRVLVSCF